MVGLKSQIVIGRKGSQAQRTGSQAHQQSPPSPPPVSALPLQLLQDLLGTAGQGVEHPGPRLAISGCRWHSYHFCVLLE